MEAEESKHPISSIMGDREEGHFSSKDAADTEREMVDGLEFNQPKRSRKQSTEFLP